MATSRAIAALDRVAASRTSRSSSSCEVTAASTTFRFGVSLFAKEKESAQKYEQRNHERQDPPALPFSSDTSEKCHLPPTVA
jgi:hypothetical protein